ncbi:MAG: MBL fold metallo-hydrolase [Bacillota bacterium]
MIEIEYELIKLNMNAVNSYLVYDKGESILIDPGSEKETFKILNVLKRSSTKLKYIINTHGHFDHIGGNEIIKNETGAEIAIHELDAKCLEDPSLNLSSYMGRSLRSVSADKILVADDVIKFGQESLKVLHCPGHTPGSISLYTEENNMIFSGDTIFANGVGRTDLPGGNARLLKESVEKLVELPEDTKVLPGHGPLSSISEFKSQN